MLKRLRDFFAPVDRDIIDWQFDTAKWFIEEFGREAFLNQTVLAEPSVEYFPSLAMPGNLDGEALFNDVRKLAGMEDWPVTLEKYDPSPETQIAETVLIQGAPYTPAGAIQFPQEEGSFPTIFYQPESLQNPPYLIATFAHELAHYLSAYSKSDPPGGWEVWEMTTDFVAVMMGFGLFMLGSSFRFDQYASVSSQGWKAQRVGYLSEGSLAYALAMFAELKTLSLDNYLGMFKASASSAYKWSVKDLASRRSEIFRIIDASENEI